MAQAEICIALLPNAPTTIQTYPNSKVACENMVEIWIKVRCKCFNVLINNVEPNICREDKQMDQEEMVILWLVMEALWARINRLTLFIKSWGKSIFKFEIVCFNLCVKKLQDNRTQTKAFFSIRWTNSNPNEQQDPPNIPYNSLSHQKVTSKEPTFFLFWDLEFILSRNDWITFLTPETRIIRHAHAIKKYCPYKCKLEF